MAFGSGAVGLGGASRADVVLRADTGQFRKDITEAQQLYQRTTGQMSDAALRMQVAQEKLDRAIARYGAESRQAKEATVRYRAEMRALQTQVDRTGRELAETDRKLGRMGQGAAGLGRGLGALRGSLIPLTAGLGGAVGLTAVLRSSYQAASDLTEQTNRARAVFGDASTAVTGWAKTTGNALGIANAAALEAAGTFGQLFHTVQLAPARAADMSKALVRLAADLASFNNANPSETLEAIRSGLIGEAEPLRRYGVLLSEARVQQEALRATGKKHAKDLSDQEKVLARYRIILKDTVPAQGDFARTSGQAANASRRLRANLTDLQANLGQGFTPAVARATGALADLTAGMRTAQITARQLANDRSLRDKFADAFDVNELFKALNAYTSPGLANRPDEGTRGAVTNRPARQPSTTTAARAPARTQQDYLLDLRRAATDTQRFAVLRPHLAYVQGAIARLEADKTLSAKQKQRLMDLYDERDKTQADIDGIIEKREAASDTAAEEAEKRRAARRKAAADRARARQARERDIEKHVAAAEAALPGNTPYANTSKGFAKGGVSAAEAARRAIKAAKGDDEKPLTLADLRRLQAEWLRGLQGITNQFGSNIAPDQTATNTWQTARLIEHQTRVLERLARSVQHPGAKYARNELMLGFGDVGGV